MKSTIYLALAFQGVLAQSAGADVAKPFRYVEANAEEARFVVAIGLAGGGVCTGALVAKQVVITAAHCVSGQKVSNLKVIFGVMPEKSKIFRKVDKLVVNPMFIDSNKLDRDASNYDILHQHDLAILSFFGEAPPGYSPVVMDYAKNAEYKTHYSAFFDFYGFGTIIVDNKEISDARLKWRNLTRQMSSYALETSENSAVYGYTCHGDSGGPLTFSKNGTNYLFAIHSASRFGCVNGISIHNSVNRDFAWIRHSMQSVGATTVPELYMNEISNCTIISDQLYKTGAQSYRGFSVTNQCHTPISCRITGSSIRLSGKLNYTDESFSLSPSAAHIIKIFNGTMVGGFVPDCSATSAPDSK